MKKTALVSIFLFVALHISSQTLSKNEADKLLYKTLTYLKTNDTATFIGMWHLDGAKWPYHERAFDKRDVKEDFKELRKFLDTALTENYKIEDIEVEKQDKNDKDYITAYKIKAWFKYNDDDTYTKGMGFNVDYINKKWCYRYSPDYSIITVAESKKK